MRASRSAWLAAIFAAACQPTETKVIVPDDVERVAWIDPASNDFEASPLWSAERAVVWSIESQRRVEFVGYGADIAAVLPADAMDQPLELAEACEPQLVAPSWVGASDGTPRRPVDVPPLTAPWVLDVCNSNDYAPPGFRCVPCGNEDCHAVEISLNNVLLETELLDLAGIQMIDANTALVVPGKLHALLRVQMPEGSLEVEPPTAEIVDGIAPEEFQGRYIAFDGDSAYIVGAIGSGQTILQVDAAGALLRRYDFAPQSTTLTVIGPRHTNGPVLAHFVGGPVMQFTGTGTVARDDLPNAVALTVLGDEEVAVVTERELIWRRAGDEVRVPLPTAYDTFEYPVHRQPRIEIIGDDLVMLAPGLPVYRWRRGASGWQERPWRVEPELEAFGLTALRDGYVIVGRSNVSGVFLFEEHDRSCTMSIESTPTIAVDSTADADAAFAVTVSLTAPGQVIRIRSRRRP